MQPSKWRCNTPKRDAVLETRKQHIKILCQVESNPLVFPAQMTPRIQALSGQHAGEVFSLEEDLHVGRSSRNQIRLDDPLVSPKHCSFWFEPSVGHCIVHDLASERGTFVNEFSFPAKILVHGDHIRVGRSVFVYLLDSEVDERLLKLTETERRWVYGNYPPDRAGAYEAAKATTLTAVLAMNASIKGLRSADDIPARVW